MGAWGTGIFSDDLAADIRGDWRDGLLDGEEPAALTERLLADHEQAREDPDERGVFWLALAAAQMETGRLAGHVRDRALAIIESGEDLERWRREDPASARQREKVLARLAEKLRGPQPAPKRLRRQEPLGVPFAVGDAVRLRNEHRSVEGLAIVVDHAEGWPRGTVDPVVELLLWGGGDVPPASELAAMPALLTVVEVLREGWPGRVRPHLWSLATNRRAEVFGPHLGEVVARGVPRAPSGDWRKGGVAGGEVLTTYADWPSLVEYLGREDHVRDVAVTREQSGRKRAKRLFKRS